MPIHNEKVSLFDHALFAHALDKGQSGSNCCLTGTTLDYSCVFFWTVFAFTLLVFIMIIGLLSFFYCQPLFHNTCLEVGLSLPTPDLTICLLTLLLSTVSFEDLSKDLNCFIYLLMFCLLSGVAPSNTKDQLNSLKTFRRGGGRRCGTQGAYYFTLI